LQTAFAKASAASVIVLPGMQTEAGVAFGALDSSTGWSEVGFEDWLHEAATTAHSAAARTSLSYLVFMIGVLLLLVFVFLDSKVVELT